MHKRQCRATQRDFENHCNKSIHNHRCLQTIQVVRGRKMPEFRRTLTHLAWLGLVRTAVINCATMLVRRSAAAMVISGFAAVIPEGRHDSRRQGVCCRCRRLNLRRLVNRQRAFQFGYLRRQRRQLKIDALGVRRIDRFKRRDIPRQRFSK